MDDFRARCNNIQGIVQFNEQGVLMQCVEPSDKLGTPLVVYFDEFTPRVSASYGDYISMNDNEHNRLAVYFSIVYNATPLQEWSQLSLEQLTALWKALELYYILPPNIMPKTPIVSKRSPKEPTFWKSVV